MPDADAIKKLRRLGKSQGVPDLVVLDRKQFKRLKNFAMAYLQRVIDDPVDGQVTAYSTAAAIETRNLAKKELKKIKTFRP